MFRWPKRTPEEDPRAVGITFVDVLFALVIAKVLEPFASFGSLSSPSIAHLILAGLLTITSWIGYHNSWNRPHYFIRFPNLPLFQFLVDVLLVVVYWLTAVSAEGVGSRGEVPSAFPETAWVAASFALYALWDWISLQIRRDPRYVRRPLDRDVPGRRHVSYSLAALMAVIAVAVWAWDPSGRNAVVFVDLGLIALIIAYRLLKECVTLEGALEVSDVKSSRVEPGCQPKREELVTGVERIAGTGGVENVFSDDREP